LEKTDNLCSYTGYEIKKKNYKLLLYAWRGTMRILSKIFIFSLIPLIGISSGFSKEIAPEEKCTVNDKQQELEDFKRMKIESVGVMDNVKRIYYGNKLNEFGDLRLPTTGKGPFPVAIIVHGGAWQSTADLDYMASIAEVLRNQGIATWNVEYSRLGSGGEWPYSFKSISKGADYLGTLADSFPLDLKRVISIGHSSGGHYALWLAGRKNLTDSSEFYVAKPINIKGVISLDGSPNLEAFAGLTRGEKVIHKLLGEPNTEEYKIRLIQTSPSEMNMSNINQFFITQQSDRLPAILNYIEKNKNAGADIDYKIICKANHFTVADMHNSQVKKLLIDQANKMVK